MGKRIDALNIIKHRKIFYIISILITIAGIVSLCVQGLNLGIDYTGGNYIKVQFEQKVAVDDLRSTVGEYVKQTPSIQEGEKNTFMIRTEAMTDDTVDTLLSDLTKTYGENEVLQNNLVSGTIGSELVRDAILALVISCVLMVIYITIRFQFLFGISSIIALIHDAFIVLSVFSIFQLEINASFIAAILTVIGYSINANIVVFDRVRENMGLYGQNNLDAMVNDSITQTLVRVINTVLTTAFALIAVLCFGGETTRVFVGGILIGVVCGGYSCTCISGSLFRDMYAKWGKGKKSKAKKA